MRRPFIFIISLFIAKFSLGQHTLDKKYSADVCACLDSFKRINLNEQSLPICFQKAMLQNSDLIIQEVKKQYGDTTEENGHKFGQELAERMSITLVKECKTYFILTDSLRYEDYKALNQDSIKLQLINLEKIDPANRNEEFYNDKALLFFEQKNYDSSLSSIKKALILNSNSFQSLYFKAWINEIKGNYDEAVLLYNKVAELTHNKNFYIFSEVAKRKKNGM